MAQAPKRGEGWSVAALVVGVLAWTVSLAVELRGWFVGGLGLGQALFVIWLGFLALAVGSAVGLACAITALVRGSRSRRSWAALAVSGVGFLLGGTLSAIAVLVP